MADERQTDVDQAIWRVMRGELDAYSTVIRLYQRDVWGFVTSLLYDREATQDIVQESFIKAFFKLESYETGTSFRSWILTVARNTALNEMRSRGRNSRHLDAYRDERLAVLEFRERDGELDDNRAVALRDCREMLPEHFRSLLSLRYSERLDIETIAKRIGRSLEAVRQSLWRIRGLLRDCIERKVSRA